MKKIVLCAALAAACAAFSTAGVSAAPANPPAPPAPNPAAEKVVTPPSRTYMDSVMRADRRGTDVRPMRGVVMAYEMEMRGGRGEGPRAMRPDNGRPMKKAKAEKRAEASVAPPPEMRARGDRGGRGPARPPRAGMREERRDAAAPYGWEGRRHHRYYQDGRVDCPYGYDHRRGDCPYYDDDRYDDGWYDEDGYGRHAPRHHRYYRD